MTTTQFVFFIFFYLKDLGEINLINSAWFGMKILNVLIPETKEITKTNQNILLSEGHQALQNTSNLRELYLYKVHGFSQSLRAHLFSVIILWHVFPQICLIPPRPFCRLQI